MSSKESPAFVQVPAALVEDLLAFPTPPAEMMMLFVDSAMEVFGRLTAGSGKPTLITKAELAFPGPFMSVRTKRKSFFFEWDQDQAVAVHIERDRYPRASKISRSIAIVSVGEEAGSMESVRNRLLGRLAPATNASRTPNV